MERTNRLLSVPTKKKKTVKKIYIFKQNSGYSSIKFCVISVQISQKHLTITVADGVMRVLCTAFVVTPSNTSKTPSHGATENPRMSTPQLMREEERQANQIRVGGVILL